MQFSPLNAMNRYPGLLLHHPNLTIIQVDSTFAGPQDPCSYFQGISQRTFSTRLLPHVGSVSSHLSGLLITMINTCGE